MVVDNKVSQGDFFTQYLLVRNIPEHSWEYCKQLCKDKKVLHVGCSDFPIFDPGTSLHLQLVGVASELHGVDPNGIDQIRKHYDGVYYRSVDAAEGYYDVILVPNVLEHTKNPGQLVKELFYNRKFKKLFVLVPNYSISAQGVYENGVFVEKVHPDHYAWYSPYTLWNLFKEEIERFHTNYELLFFDNGSMISILITRND